MTEVKEPKFLVRVPLGVLRELAPTTAGQFLVGEILSSGVDHVELRCPVELVRSSVDGAYNLVEDKEAE